MNPIPGAFRAKCALTKRVPEKKLSSEEIADARAKGYARVFLELVSEKRDREKGKNGRWEIAFPGCEGFETEDRSAFEKHMAEAHGRKTSSWATSRGHSEAFARSVRAGWPKIRIPAEGKPFKYVPGVTAACSGCGLVVELGAGSDAFIEEHKATCEERRA